MSFRSYISESDGFGFKLDTVKPYSDLWWSLFKDGVRISEELYDSGVVVVFKTDIGIISMIGEDLNECKEKLKRKYGVGYSSYERLPGGYVVHLRAPYGINYLEIESKGGDENNIWIDREGLCYLTDFYGHGVTAVLLGSTEKSLEDKGWAKVSGGKAWFTRGLTEEQKEVIIGIKAVVDPAYKAEFEGQLTEDKKEIKTWYHGDSNKRDNFCNQKMDRDAFIRDTNANGPGIYFTDNYSEAIGYASPKGYVYTVQIDTSKGKVINEKDKSSNNKELLFKLLKKAQEYDSEGVWYALTDYGYEIEEPSFVKDSHLKMVINNYNNFSLIDACIMVYREFFRRNAEEWAKAMAEIGIIGYLHSQKESVHFIIYDCEVIKIIEEKSFETLNEWYSPSKPSKVTKSVVNKAGVPG